MRFPRTNTSNAAADLSKGEGDQANANEAGYDEGAAKRRAYLERKLLEAREAKRRGEIARAEEAARNAAAQAEAAAHAAVAQPSAPQGEPAAPADVAESQVWQSAFSLAPNVRFTRTPESQIRRHPPETPVVAPAPVKPPVAPQAAVAAPRAPSMAPVQPAPAVQRSVAPAAPTPAPVPPALPVRAAQRLIEEIFIPAAAYVPPAPMQPVKPQMTPVAATVTSAPQAVSRLAYLSDFAFWDAMPFEEGAMPAPAAVATVSVPRIELPAEALISHYRIFDWRPGKPAELAQVLPAPAPVQQAAPAPQPAPIAAAAPLPMPVIFPVAAMVSIQPEPAAAPAPAAFPVQIEAQPQPVEAVAPVAETPAVIEEPAAAQPASASRLQVAPMRERPISPAPMEWRPVTVAEDGEYQLPPRELLQEPAERTGVIMTQETLEQNAGLLESVLEDFGVKGEIIHVRPGPVVTLYEFEPAPGVKSSRVIGLADDIARSMSALSARVAVVPGRNVIGIELPNALRETVYFREMIDSEDFTRSGFKLALGLGKTIGGEPVIAELAKMPHLLVAGTTGSGKSVAINTMILSLLYRMTPQQCRLIMVDPKMLELSVYDGIPHLLTPVVTDPKKAVMALKWAVREMEDRYRKMSRLGVRNIDGYNARVATARDKGETIHVVVQTGFDRGTGAPIEETQEMDLTPMPYIVVIVDEMADLMMVAGKEIEGAIQRLAQMARAAGIHLIMATQRPSVDVITGTIKANFPTRISFQVTSKIDSRTILGEQGAEQLLGQGDMLHMQGGGRIARVHGPFVSDEEVEKVVAHLKMQGRPEYLDTVTADEEEEEEEEEQSAVFDKTAMGAEDGDDLYEQAVKVVMRDKKCSTSYIQRRLGIGYNRAASLVERMEKEGLVGAANHVGKREIISGRDGARADEE